jgi:hypothetical protein
MAITVPLVDAGLWWFSLPASSRNAPRQTSHEPHAGSNPGFIPITVRAWSDALAT